MVLAVQLLARTEGANDDDQSSVSSSHSKIFGYHSNEDKEEFDENLPTDYSLLGPPSPEKVEVIEDTVVVEKRKSEATKTIPDSLMKSSKETTETSKAEGTPETPKIDVPFINKSIITTVLGDYLMQEEDSSMLVAYLSKNEFRDNGHIRSGKYYLPFAPNLNLLAKGSGLLTSLNNKAKRDPCGAIYQQCHPTVPMIKYQNPQILDSSPMRLKYWDNSVLLLSNG